MFYYSIFVGDYDFYKYLAILPAMQNFILIVYQVSRIKVSGTHNITVITVKLLLISRRWLNEIEILKW